jgi:hypothetical protein
VDNGMLMHMSILIVRVCRMKVQSGEKKSRQQYDRQECDAPGFESQCGHTLSLL